LRGFGLVPGEHARALIDQRDGNIPVIESDADNQLSVGLLACADLGSIH
jgi:hypothetical protein